MSCAGGCERRLLSVCSGRGGKQRALCRSKGRKWMEQTVALSVGPVGRGRASLDVCISIPDTQSQTQCQMTTHALRHTR